MNKSLRIINQVKIGTPCSSRNVSGAMNGEKLFCSDCQKTVYNFSQMTPKQIVWLLMTKKNLCGRITYLENGQIKVKEHEPMVYKYMLSFVAGMFFFVNVGNASATENSTEPTPLAEQTTINSIPDSDSKQVNIDSLPLVEPSGCSDGSHNFCGNYSEISFTGDILVPNTGVQNILRHLEGAVGAVATVGSLFVSFLLGVCSLSHRKYFKYAFGAFGIGMITFSIRAMISLLF